MNVSYSNVSPIRTGYPVLHSGSALPFVIPARKYTRGVRRGLRIPTTGCSSLRQDPRWETLSSQEEYRESCLESGPGLTNSRARCRTHSGNSSRVSKNGTVPVSHFQSLGCDVRGGLSSERHRLFSEVTLTSASHRRTVDPNSRKRRETFSARSDRSGDCETLLGRYDSGISALSYASDQSLTAITGTSTISADSINESGVRNRCLDQPRGEFLSVEKDSCFNNWAYKWDSAFGDSLDHPMSNFKRYPAHTVYAGRERRRRHSTVTSLRAIEETERMELRKQLHAVCFMQRRTRSQDLGGIEYWLRYDHLRHILSVRVVQAENLCRKSPPEKVSTFVRVTLGTDTDSAISHETEVVRKTCDPVYDHEMTFPLKPTDLRYANLAVRVCRKRSKLSGSFCLGSDIVLGMVSSPTNGLLINPGRLERQDLKKEPVASKKSPRLNISMCFNPKRQAIEATIIKIAGLPKSKIVAAPDTKVKITFNQIAHGEVQTFEYSTRTKRWNANPVFKEVFSLPVRCVSSLRDAVSVTCKVMCQDRLSRKTEFGSVGFGVSSSQESERTQWERMLSNPGNPYNFWHSLSQG